MAAYIKFDGVNGESQDKHHKGWSDLLSFEQGAVRESGGAAGGQRAAISVSDVHCAKLLDSASCILFQGMCDNMHYPKVMIHVTASTTDGGRETFFSYELKNVHISAHRISGQGQSVPVESLSLAFKEITVEYGVVGKDGVPKGTASATYLVEKASK